MREMKESGVTWVGKIPAAWEMKTIKQLMIERVEKNKELEVNTILSLSAKDGVTLYNSENHSGNKPREDLSDYKIVRENDIVVNSMNILSGSVGLSAYTGVVSPVYYIYYPRDDGNVEYFHYIFQCFEFQRSLRGLGNGILIKETESGGLNTIRMRIPSQKLGAQEFPYCSRNEQDRIVAALEASVKKVDALIANQETQIEKLKAYKQSLITEVVTKGLDPNVPMKDSGVEWIGKIPQSWYVIKNRNIFRNKTVKGHGDATVLSVYRDWGVVPKDSRDDNWNVTSLDTDSYKYIEPGDLVINKMKAWSGSLSISDYAGIVSPAYYTCTVNYSIVDQRFIHHYLRNKKLVSMYEMYSAGMRIGQWDLSIDDFLGIEVAIPQSKEEQKLIADYLDKKCDKVDKLIFIKQQKIEKLNQYKKSLIYEYVTGKKEVM